MIAQMSVRIILALEKRKFYKNIKINKKVIQKKYKKSTKKVQKK